MCYRVILLCDKSKTSRDKIQGEVTSPSLSHQPRLAENSASDLRIPADVFSHRISWCGENEISVGRHKISVRPRDVRILEAPWTSTSENRWRTGSPRTKSHGIKLCEFINSGRLHAPKPHALSSACPPCHLYSLGPDGSDIQSSSREKLW